MTHFHKTHFRELFCISKFITLLYFEFSKDFTFSGEQHDFWEFIYIDKGEILIVADTSEYVLKSGEMAFHKPDEFHSVRANGKVASNVVIISFECNSASMRFFENKILFLDEKEKHLLSEIVREGQSAYEKVPSKPPVTGMKRRSSIPAGAEQMVKLHLEMLLIHIYRRRDTIFRYERYTLSPQQHFESKLTQDIMTYLQNHVYYILTLEKISADLGVSKSQIKKVFKKQTDKSVIDFFIHLKIQEAKRLIREEEINFTQIAERLSYTNIHYFSRIFKHKTGMTPSEFALSVKPLGFT